MFSKKKKYRNYGRIGKRTDAGYDVYVSNNPNHVYVEFERPLSVFAGRLIEWPIDRIQPNLRLIAGLPVKLNAETGILELSL